MVVLLAADLGERVTVASLDMTRGSFNGVVYRSQTRERKEKKYVKVKSSASWISLFSHAWSPRRVAFHYVIELPHESSNTFPLFVQEHIHSARVN